MDRELELVTARNAELNQVVVRAEAEKSKALMRLVTLCTGVPPPSSSSSSSPSSPRTSAAPTTADTTFLTSLDPTDPDASSHPPPPSASTPPSSSSPSPFDHLILSELGLTDSHLALLSPLIGRSSTLREVDLRGNHLTTPSVVALIGACLTPGNRVHMVDLQQNQVTLDGLEEVAREVMRAGRRGSEGAGGGGGGAEGGGVLGASLYRQGAVLLPILQLRLPHKLLLIDLRYNRLQHLRQGVSSGTPAGGESVKQLMKRVLLRVCRLLNSVGQGGGEDSMAGVDLEQRTTWMTPTEVDHLLAVNAQRKADDDRRRAALSTSFDTQLTVGATRRMSELEQKNVHAVRPVLPGPPKRGSRGGGVGGVVGLPRIGSAEGRRGGSAKTVEEEMKVQEEVVVVTPRRAAEVEAEAPVLGEEVEGAVDVGEDAYEDEEFHDREAVAAE